MRARSSSMRAGSNLSLAGGGGGGGGLAASVHGLPAVPVVVGFGDEAHDGFADSVVPAECLDRVDQLGQRDEVLRVARDGDEREVRGDDGVLREVVELRRA